MAGGEPRSAADQDRLEEVKWLIAREIPHLRRYAMALVRNRDEADDLVQDCLERAIRKRHQWRSHGSIRNWLFRTLYRTFLNGLPRRVREQGQVELEAGHAAHYESLGTAPHQESHLEWLDMAAALGRLPQQQHAGADNPDDNSAGGRIGNMKGSTDHGRLRAAKASFINRCSLRNSSVRRQASSAAAAL